MAQLLVRNIDDSLKDELKEIARENGRSLEAEVRERLSVSVESSRARRELRRAMRAASSQDEDESVEFGTQIVRLFSGQEIGFDEEDLARIEKYRMAPRPDPYFWRDYGKGERDYGFTQEDIERMEAIKREPVPDPISFE